jgi:hypothetical protein
MGFGKFGFGKAANLFTQGANSCAPNSGGHGGPFDLGQLGHHLGQIGSGFGHGGGSQGHMGGQQNDHHGGNHDSHHGGHHGGHAGGLPGGDGCADDENSDAGSDGNGSTGGTGFPDIPADTSGITFHVDFDGDGTMDNYYPVGRASDLKTFEDYYSAAKEQILADHPDADTSKVVIKATITSRSGGETYYHFTGLEEGGAPVAEDDDHDDDSTGDDGNHDHHGRGGHGHGNGSHGKDDEGHGGTCGNKDADFFASLGSHGGKSFDCTSHDDEDAHQDDDDSHDDDDHGFSFC